MTSAVPLAVVIVTHDSADDLRTVLPALLPQLESNDELVIVDCASPQGPPQVPAPARLVALDENRGFAGGACAGAAVTTAPLILFLNPDGVPAEGCLRALRAAAQDRPRWGAWQALVTVAGTECVNSSGGVIHYLGFAWAGGHGSPLTDVSRSPHQVGFASGAALVVRRDAWDAVGGFDPAYFMYCEDVDLSLRLRLAGWHVGVVPAARVEHSYEFEKGGYKWFYLERNRLFTVVATYPRALLISLAPALLAFELALLPLAASSGWLKPKLRADWAVLRAVPALLRRRAAVQRTRRISAHEFASGLSASLDSPFLSAADAVPVLVRAQRMYWRLVQGAVRARRG